MNINRPVEYEHNYLDKLIDLIFTDYPNDMELKLSEGILKIDLYLPALYLNISGKTYKRLKSSWWFWVLLTKWYPTIICLKFHRRILLDSSNISCSKL